MLATSDTRNEQLRQFQPMVARMAYHMVSRLPASVEVDDLIQVGMIGLNDAISRCEPSTGELEKFARFRIKGAMIDELREVDWASRQCRNYLSPVSVSRVPRPRGAPGAR
jgi:RNA polymerase sigma factor for flagellar operon FliA